MPSLLDDPEAYAFANLDEDRRRKLTNQQALNAILQGVGDLPYTLLGAPVEISTGLLRAGGMAQGEQAGGIDYFKRKATELGIRPLDSDDPTMRDMRMGAEIAMGGVDPTRVARAGGAVAGAVAREAKPIIGDALEGYMAKSGLAPRIVPEGGLTRSLQQGFEHDWYHGTTGDIKSFDKGLLGEATGAPSASEGFFFARDPVSPPASMAQKTSDPKSIELLKKLGKSDKEIADINSVSMLGNGAETASGYAQLRGGRDYKAAMRKANAAEKRQDFDEYDKQMQIAENIETKYDNDLQTLIAKYGDARDVMTEKVNNTFYSLENTQAKAELLDKKYKELMPYNWFVEYDQNQFNNLKKELVELVGKDKAKTALSAIDEFISVKNERNLLDKTTQGGNVMPVALRYKNPMYHDFGGKAYREQTYKELLQEAKSKGHDALILKNTIDPGAGKAKLVDVGVVFEPNQIRSKFAKFDPVKINSPDLLAGALPFGILGADEETKKDMQSLLGY